MPENDGLDLSLELAEQGDASWEHGARLAPPNRNELVERRGGFPLSMGGYGLVPVPLNFSPGLPGKFTSDGRITFLDFCSESK
jgi:hypothetical protein